MKLLDRILLLNCIAGAQSSVTGLIVLSDVRKKIALTEEEKIAYEIKETGSVTAWNELGRDAEFEITFSEAETAEIKKCLEKMSKLETLTAAHLNLCKEFNVQ